MVKKLVLFMVLLLTFVTSVAFGAPLDDPILVKDNAFAKSELERHKTIYAMYNYQPLNIGDQIAGITGGRYLTAPNRIEKKCPIYILNVEKEGFVDLGLNATNLMYGNKPRATVNYISQQTGTKTWENVSYNTYTRFENGVFSFYAFPGTYYIQVFGENYKTSEKKGVDNQYLNFTLKTSYNTHLESSNFVAQNKTAVVFNIVENTQGNIIEPAGEIHGTVSFRGETKEIISTKRYDTFNGWDYYSNTVRFEDVPTDITFDITVEAEGYKSYKKPFMRQTTDLSSEARYQTNPVYYSEIYLDAGSDENLVLTETGQNDNLVEKALVNDKKELEIGDLVQIGSYNDEAIIWRYMGKNDKGLYLISDKILSFKGFSPIGATIDGHDENILAPSGLPDRSVFGDPRWTTSPLKIWLNNSGQIDYHAYGVNAPNKFFTIQFRDDQGMMKYVDNSYEMEYGFLSGFTEKEISLIKNVSHKTLLGTYDQQFSEGGDALYNQYVSGFQLLGNFKSEDYNNALYLTSNEKIFLPSVEEIYEFFYKNSFETGAKPTQSAFDLDESKSQNGLSVNDYYPYWLRTPQTYGPLGPVTTEVLTMDTGMAGFDAQGNPVKTTYLKTEPARSSVNQMNEALNGNTIKAASQDRAIGVRPALYLKENLSYVQDERGYWVPKN